MPVRSVTAALRASTCSPLLAGGAPRSRALPRAPSPDRAPPAPGGGGGRRAPPWARPGWRRAACCPLTPRSGGGGPPRAPPPPDPPPPTPASSASSRRVSPADSPAGAAVAPRAPNVATSSTTGSRRGDGEGGAMALDFERHFQLLPGTPSCQPPPTVSPPRRDPQPPPARSHGP